MEERVSVALAACQGEKYIEEQVRSILDQLGKTDELVVSVDPSTDKTEEILRDMHDVRIKIIAGPGKGVVKNFENAISHTSGDLILLSDQDDVWMPDKVQVMKECLQDHILVVHDAIILGSDLDGQRYQAYHRSRSGFLNNVIRNSFIGCCMGFRAELKPVILPFPAMVPMHDHWIGLAACKSGKVLFTDKPLIWYRRHENNQTQMTHSGIKEMFWWRVHILRALKERKLI